MIQIKTRFLCPRIPELGMIEVRIQPFLFQELFVSGMGFGTVGVLDDTALI